MSQQKLLQAVFQDQKPREILAINSFGDILFKTKNTQGDCYAVLQIYINNNNTNRQYAFYFRQHLLGNSAKQYKQFLSGKGLFRTAEQKKLHETLMLREGLLETLDKKLSKKPNEVYIANAYLSNLDNIEAFYTLPSDAFYEKLLQECTFNEDTLTDLTEIDNIGDKPPFYIQKLYYGYGREDSAVKEKLYECINLQDLSVWNEFGDFLNEQISKLQQLSTVSVYNMHSIPDAFLNNLHTLPNLVSLTLGRHSSNALDHQYQLKTLPENLVALQNLKYLNLDGNQLADFAEISRLSHLKTLSVYNNQFTNLEGIAGLKHITVLNLANNAITELPIALKELSQLKVLILSKNPLQEIPSWLGELTQLEELHLEQTQLKTLPESIGQLTQLKVLGLKKNPFETLPKVMGKIPKRVLDLELRNRALFDAKAKQKLSEYPEGDFLFESDLNFKLLVIQKLMYEDEVLLPKFNIYDFAKTHDIDIEERGYNILPEAVEYFKNIKIPSSLLIDIEELYPDGGSEIYSQLYPFWDGEDDCFDVKSIADIEYLPRLKRINNLFFNKDLVKELRKRKIKVSNY